MTHEYSKKPWMAPFIAFALICLAMIAFVSFAHAQGAVETFIGGFRGPIIEIVSILIAAFVAWLTSWLRTLFNMQVEEKDRQALQSALEHAAQMVIDRALRTQSQETSSDAVGAAIVGKELVKEVGLNITQTALNVGIGYVKQSVPDAVKRFGLDDLFIDTLLRPHLTKVLTNLIK